MKPRAHKHTRIRWSMLVSHHAPCDYDRTIHILGLRVCTRCLGMVAGCLPGWLLSQACIGFGYKWCLIGSLAMTLPAAYDFSANELSRNYRSTNLRRFVTGLTFGFVVGTCLASVWSGNAWPFLGLLAYLALMQVVIVKLFQIHGHCDAYLERYSSAVYEKTEANSTWQEPK